MWQTAAVPSNGFTARVWDNHGLEKDVVPAQKCFGSNSPPLKCFGVNNNWVRLFTNHHNQHVMDDVVSSRRCHVHHVYAIFRGRRAASNDSTAKRATRKKFWRDRWDRMEWTSKAKKMNESGEGPAPFKWRHLSEIHMSPSLWTSSHPSLNNNNIQKDSPRTASSSINRLVSKESAIFVGALRIFVSKLPRFHRTKSNRRATTY